MHHPLGAFYSLLGSSLVPRLISFFGHRRKEPGEIGSFKPLISGGSDRVPPLKLQNQSMWMRDSLKVWRTKSRRQRQTRSDKTTKNSLH